MSKDGMSHHGMTSMQKDEMDKPAMHKKHKAMKSTA